MTSNRPPPPSLLFFIEDNPTAQQPQEHHQQSLLNPNASANRPPIKCTTTNSRFNLQSQLRYESNARPNRSSPLFTSSPTFANYNNKPPTPSANGDDNGNSDIEDILKFPIESSHAYSYAHLSPNSLALRLNVLKRSLEILKDRPELFKSLTTTNSATNSPVQSSAPPTATSINISIDEASPLFRSASHPVEIDTNMSTEDLSLQPPPLRKTLYMQTNHSSDYIHDVSGASSLSANEHKNYKLRSNASSAALAALFRPTMKRSDSLPLNNNTSIPVTGRRVSTPPLVRELPTSRKTSSSKNKNDDFKDIIDLLENDLSALLDNSEVATTLHDLSLSTPDNLDDTNSNHDILKHKLLHALAMPFIENSVQPTSLLEFDGTSDPSLNSSHVRPSTTALNLLNNNYDEPPAKNRFNNNNNNNFKNSAASRPFHSLLTTKHALPQSVFTVDKDLPFSVKAANDLACLMFGVLKNTIKALTLMDLIAPQFRDFVLKRITGVQIMENKKNRDRILFAGEIVAIVRPGDQNYSWTSLWAKRKGNLIICMFDQIPCDAFDVVILSEKDVIDYKIDSINEIAGSLIEDYGIQNLSSLNSLSYSLNKELLEFHHNNEAEQDAIDETDQTNHTNNTNRDSFDIDEYYDEDIELINQTRYYTLQLEDENNVPCAITSTPLELDQEKHEIKLKIHTMPYIAGIFVIDSNEYKILSCNNAIARNLFGKSFDELENHSIDELIPNFTKILHAGIEATSNYAYQLSPGLVLPEHFFRKYDAFIKKQQNPENDQESKETIFFNSKGIEAVHRDGKVVYIDVQVRVSTNNTLVVWVTYSRTNKNRTNISEELDKLSSASTSSSISLASSNKSAVSLSSISKPRTYSSGLQLSDLKQQQQPQHLPLLLLQFLTKPSQQQSANLLQNIGGHERKLTTTSTVPSQMKLFNNEKENDLLEFSPREITRALSTRKPKKETSLGIPLTRLDSYIYDKNGREQQNLQRKEEKKPAKDLQNPLSEPTLSSPLALSSQADDSVKTDFNIVLKYTQEEILELENESLEQIKCQSSHWPKDVGTQRRTKKFSEFKVLKDMGEGAYGKVVLAQHKQDPLYKIIIKCINKERILVDTWVRDRKLGTIPSEIQIMAYLNSEPHPNIMRIIDFFEDSKYYYLETPIFGDPPAIDLFDFIEIKKDLSEVESKFIFKQIVSSIYHLHKNGIVHRDIKDENIIVDEKGVIKLIDFGSAGYVKQGPFDVFVGTIDYASPEVLGGEKYEGKPQDIWALGILLYTMLYKENPFYNVDEIMEGDLRIPYVISETSLTLIKKILVRDVDERPTITDIMEDEWLQI